MHACFPIVFDAFPGFFLSTFKHFVEFLLFICKVIAVALQFHCLRSPMVSFSYFPFPRRKALLAQQDRDYHLSQKAPAQGHKDNMSLTQHTTSLRRTLYAILHIIFIYIYIYSGITSTRLFLYFS